MSTCHVGLGFDPCCSLFLFHEFIQGKVRLVANVLCHEIKASKFKPQLHNYIHFQTDTLGKVGTLLIPPNLV